METWNEEAGIPVIVPATDKWQGEDEDDDVKDNWDDEDEEPKSESAADPAKPAAASKNQAKARKAKIAEKEKAKAKAGEQRVLTAEEELAERLERQRLQEESDFELGKLGLGINEGTGTGLDSLPLSTPEDFETFKKALVDRLKLAEKSPHYVSFLENAFRDICASMEPDDIKRLSSNLNSLFNEKMKAQKSAKPKKGKAKAGIKVERSALDYADGGEFDDFDEFM